MSREIKFRGWNKRFKKMLPIYGLRLSGSNNEVNKVSQNEKQFDVSEVEVMQFTGITDKNKQELYYDSDLVKLPEFDGLFIAVKDSFDIPCFIRPDNCLKEVIQFSDYFLQATKRGDDFEVIGNIYENPELL